MGTVQGLTAVACGALILIPAVATRNWSPLKYSWTHIKHGLGNIIVGTLEAIPLIQTALYGLRQLRQYGGSAQIHLFTGHENKFMPYPSLAEKDFFIGGGDTHAVQSAEESYQQKLVARGGEKSLSGKEKMELAREAIDESR